MLGGSTMERIFGTLTQKTGLQTAMLLKTQTIITSLLSHSSFFGVGSVTRYDIYAVPFHYPPLYYQFFFLGVQYAF